MAGILLTLVAFPTDAAMGQVDPEIMRRLASIYLPVMAGMTALSIGVLTFYRIDEVGHARNLAALSEAAAQLEEARESAPEPRPT